jgi:hypothetical protein
LAASTVGSYLAGVRHFLQLQFLSTKFLDDPAIALLRAGINRTQRFRETESEGKLPFVAEMINKMQSLMGPLDPSSASFGTLTATRLAYSCLLRRSEYIPSKNGKHWIRAQDVSFVLHDGSIIGGHLMSPQLVDSVARVFIYLRSSKTDQNRKGYTFVLYVDANDDTDTGKLMSLYAGHNLLQFDKPFFASFNSVSGKPWCISAKRVQAVLRETARQCGFKTCEIKRFTTHSLRYGGASTLNEAKVPKHKIKFSGRWKSDAFETYCQHSHKLFRSTQNILRNPATLSVAKVMETARTLRSF